MTFSPEYSGKNRQESLETIVFKPEPWSDPRVFQRTEHYRNTTEGSLLKAIDSQFSLYLETIVALEDYQDAGTCASWWKTAVATRPLSEVIREAVSLDEDSQRELTPLELITRLCEWRSFINSHPAIKGLNNVDVMELDTGTPLDLWYCRAFKQDATQIPGAGLYVPERFFSHLLNTVFFRDLGPTPEAIAEEDRAQVALEFRWALRELILVVSIVELDDSQRRRSLTHHALKAMFTVTDVDAQRRFLEESSPFPEDGAQGSAEQIIVACEASLRQLLGSHWEDSIKRELGRSVVLGDRDVLEGIRRRLLDPAEAPSPDAPNIRPIVEIVPVTNFYFSPDPVKPLTAHDREHLPEREKMISSRDSRDFLGGIRDGSLFDSAGNKVWWGDLSEADITNLRGPLYLLSQQDSYHDVPDWIRLTSRPVVTNEMQREFQQQDVGEEANLKDEALTLICDYVRLKAVGKIVAGKWIENPKTIEPT